MLKIIIVAMTVSLVGCTTVNVKPKCPWYNKVQK